VVRDEQKRKKEHQKTVKQGLEEDKIIRKMKPIVRLAKNLSVEVRMCVSVWQMQHHTVMLHLPCDVASAVVDGVVAASSLDTAAGSKYAAICLSSHKRGFFAGRSCLLDRVDLRGNPIVNPVSLSKSPRSRLPPISPPGAKVWEACGNSGAARLAACPDICPNLWQVDNLYGFRNSVRNLNVEIDQKHPV